MKRVIVSQKAVLCVSLICVAWAVWIGFAYTHVSNYFYLYPEITSLWEFTSWTLANLLLPTIPLIIGIIFVFYRKYKNAKICSTLFFLFLLISVVRGTVEILYLPTVHSYTDDIENFGVFDGALENNLTLNPVPYFPEEIPDEVQNVQYCYYYEYASSETTYIAISWQYENRDAFLDIISEFNKQLPTDRNCFYFTDAYYCNAVLWDEGNARIVYLISTEEEYLPTSLNDAFDTYLDFSD